MSSATCGVAVAVEATIASRAEPARGVGEAEVVGPEVVPPLRDAVRLVDDEQPDPRLPDPLEEPGRGEALGRDVEQPQLAPTPRASSAARFARRVLLGVDERDRPGARALERLDLVLHQRDERRDDERQVVAHQRRQLVAERLARAGRHDDEHVAAGDAPPRTASRWPGRKAAKPKTSRSAARAPCAPRRTAAAARPEARQGAARSADR